MPKYYGCPCEGCGKPLTLQDDIVVCPDCGAPYHRTCYEKMGLCIHAPAHGAGYEWKFPYQDAQLRTCPACGERTLRSESVCRCCGAALPPETEADEQLNDRKAAQDEQHGGFDYERFYRQYEHRGRRVRRKCRPHRLRPCRRAPAGSAPPPRCGPCRSGTA